MRGMFALLFRSPAKDWCLLRTRSGQLFLRRRRRHAPTRPTTPLRCSMQYLYEGLESTTTTVDCRGARGLGFADCVTEAERSP
jgi:hypothetical protein